MEKSKMARLLIQLFADDSETTEPEIDEEVEETEEEETEEFTDESEPVEETTEEPEKVKTFSQDEVNKMIENRIKRERNRVARDYETKLSKYEELAYLTQNGLKANDLDETLEKSRTFYEKQGIKYTPSRSNREEEILANVDAQEIIDNCDSIDEIETEVKRLLDKGNNISTRERNVAQLLVNEMQSRKKSSDYAKLGVKEEVYNSKEFKEFEKHFTNDTPAEEIYNLYSSKIKSTKKVEKIGSMKSTPSKTKKSFISEADYDKMSKEEIRKNMDLIEKSMSKW